MPTLTPLKRFRDRNSKLFHPEIRRVPGLDIPHYFPGCIEAINFHSTPLVERKLTDGDKFAQTLSLFARFHWPHNFFENLAQHCGSRLAM